jgi:hypothetical protein
MAEPKSAFDTSGPSIWMRDKNLVQINNGKINGSRRREQLRQSQPFVDHDEKKAKAKEE